MKNPADIAYIISEDVHENNGLLAEEAFDVKIQKRSNYQGENTVELTAFTDIEDGWGIEELQKAFTLVWNALASDESYITDKFKIDTVSKKVTFRKNDRRPIVYGEVSVSVTPELITPRPPESDDINTSLLFAELTKRGYK